MAGENIDLRIAELLAARLCHELVSPIGAIANGLEILEDEPDFSGDAGALIALSARQATRRLQFYRVAYGSTTDLSDEVARRAAVELFAEGKIGCDWRAAALPKGWQKLACNLVLLASEALPRGGQIVLEKDASGGIVATVAGEGARLQEAALEIISTGWHAEVLSPRTVQAVFTVTLAHREAAVIEVRQVNVNELALIVKVK
jgi:histidine phosphotransferase ChpT